MAGLNRMPDGPWVKEPRSHHWLPFKKIPYYSDITGTEFIELQKNIREVVIREAVDVLHEHGIEIINVATQQIHDHKTYSDIMGVAIAFKSKEDLVMAKMILKCDD
jgi:hypothetical protein